ncbi:MIF4G domain-containing protein [Aspergillus candidus]|uniref:MI domain-containing protein n=1 Tax=Aspergillus candidus TaxID=41067 RepID=A0A2I2FJY9_ASPCN|nr:hypothetical protein BDW47DRAFT_73959 [Aspergillus candidus]PLB40958.1 hypothetical protein BDW47DRAFT_73959 [Aspergillus candidus]
MRRPMHLTTGLPRNLRAELGIKDTYGDKKKNKRSGPLTRKDRRQAERSNKKTKRAPIPASKYSSGKQADDDDEEDDDEDAFDGFDGSGMDSDMGESADEVATNKSKSTKTADQKPKSILKAKKGQDTDPDLESEEGSEEEDKPRRRNITATMKDKLDQDDAEIAALEKKLGMKKGKKLPKSFQEDGLEDLLGELDEGSGDEKRKRKREADEWLLSKRRKAQGIQSESEDDDEDMDLGSDKDMDDMEGEDMEDLEEDFSDEDDQEDEETKPTPKKKENPYVAPVSEKPAQKYIPPSLRAAASPESESLTRLRRQAQGQLNKLSEANLVSILAEFEKLYRDHPRQNVTSTLISLLFGLICERSVHQDTFMVLHAGFIAAIYKIVGMDFGAELVQKVVETLDAGGDERGSFEGKESTNLISLLSQLYNFHVIGSALIFDYIRLYLQDITEENTELLLKIIRNSGPQLRQDDPSSLKDIVLLIQPAVAKAGEASLSVRTKFMIDTITDLKNNKIKAGVNANIASEHLTKMRKILGSLNNTRVVRASEPISISRNDIHNSTKKGKWWLVGASWREDPLESARQELSGLPTDSKAAAAVEDDDSEGEPDLVQLAKSHRMNTDVRRSIFVAIMSAQDYQDAHVRLLKLRLKRVQEFEIPRVLTHCAMEEESYNPYYTLIARRVCGELGRRLKVSFMYTLWNAFKRMGESGDMGDDDDEDDAFGAEDEENQLPMKALVNLAKMYGTLVADGTLNLGILKTLNFAYLQPKSKTFVELLLITVIQQSQKAKTAAKKSKKDKKEGQDVESERDERALIDIFLRTRETPQIAKGLIFFLRKVVAKTDIVSSSKEQKMVKWGCGAAVDALKVVAKEEEGV